MTTTLGNFCTIIMGQAPAGATYSLTYGTPLIAGAGDFSEGQLKPKKFTNMPTKLSRKGDVVLSIRASIGDKVWSDGQYCLGRGVAGLRPGEALHGTYLWHWLDHIEPALRAKAKGATFLQVNRSDIANLPISLPPIEEQRRIAAILDKADDLRTKRRQAIAHLDALTQSIFHSMFGDPQQAIGQRVLGELLSSIDSGSSPISEDRQAEPHEWGILKVSAVTTQTFIDAENKALVASEPNTQHEVRTGDVLFTRKNTPKLVAAVAIVRSTRPKLLLPDLVFRLNIADRNELEPEYLQAVMAYPSQRASVQRLAGGSAASMSNIAKSKLAKVTIPLPPIELQQAYATRVAAVERLKETHRKHLAELDALFASLQNRAFKGEL